MNYFNIFHDCAFVVKNTRSTIWLVTHVGSRWATVRHLVLGSLEGFVYWDFWEKKGMYIWVPLPWTQRTLKIKSGGHL